MLYWILITLKGFNMAGFSFSFFKWVLLFFPCSLPSCSFTRAIRRQIWRPLSGESTRCSQHLLMINWEPSRTNTHISKSSKKITGARIISKCCFWLTIGSFNMFSGCFLKLRLCHCSVSTFWRKPWALSDVSGSEVGKMKLKMSESIFQISLKRKHVYKMWICLIFMCCVVCPLYHNIIIRQ